jgi:phage terminase large subunit-like protein
MLMTNLPRVRSQSFATSFDGILSESDPSEELDSYVETLTRAEVQQVLRHWPIHCRDAQCPPETWGDPAAWTAWLVLGGRGAGKTRTGAEWVRGIVRAEPGFAESAVGRIALVGETFAAVRDVMIEGPAGILAVYDKRGETRPAWSPSLRRLDWPNGAVAHAFSSEDPDSLRGPQFESAWCDELAKWRHPTETWDMLQFGLRLGPAPREVVTTTPRAIPLLKRLLADPRVVVSRSRTADNASNLAPAFLETIVGRYAGTRLGRQELEGELIEEREDALWSRDRIEALRVEAAPPLARIVVAVDPPASSSARADACGIVVAGMDPGGLGYVLADASIEAARPTDWAERAIAAYRRWSADALVAEANQGGEMVRAVLAQVDPTVPITTVHATRGKYVRAEPVAVLYDQGRVRHVGAFPELEDELCDFGPGGLSSARSPDRLDALVWALSHLMLTRAEPRVRAL